MKVERKEMEEFEGAYVLSHPVRAAITKLLKKEGAMYTSKIAKTLDFSDRLIAFHLSMLASAGFVESNYQLTNPGTPPRIARYYSLTDKVDKTLAEFMASMK